MKHKCFSSDLHPYECNHDNTCPHCANIKSKNHDPEKCWLCCNGDPEQNKPIKMGLVIGKPIIEWLIEQRKNGFIKSWEMTDVDNPKKFLIEFN